MIIHDTALRQVIQEAILSLKDAALYSKSHGELEVAEGQDQVASNLELHLKRILPEDPDNLPG